MATYSSPFKKSKKLKQILIREKTTRPGYTFGYQLPPVDNSLTKNLVPGPAMYRITKNTWDKNTT